MTTTTRPETLQKVLEKSNPNTLADALKKVGGMRHALIKAVFTGLSDVAAQDITTAAAKAAATITGIDALPAGTNLPAIGQVVTLRTTAGTLATHGPHIVTDAGGTALVPQADSPGVAKLSDDGTEITFQAGVTAFVLQYYPRSETAMTDNYASS